jgi:hypothetical protein
MTGRTHDLAAFTALGIVVLAQPPRIVTLATAILAIFPELRQDPRDSTQALD